MAHAATTSLSYAPSEPGITTITAHFDVAYAGADLFEGNILVGLSIEVDPTVDTPQTIKNRITDAVRARAQYLVASDSSTGVAIGPNAILVGTDFSKG